MLNNSKSTRYSSLPLFEIVCICVGPCDEEAWDEFVSGVKKPLSLIVMRTASKWAKPSSDLVEDLMQATYFKLWQGGRTRLEGICNRASRCRLGISDESRRQRYS